MVLIIGADHDVAGYSILGVLLVAVGWALVAAALIALLTRRAHKPAEVKDWARSYGVRLTDRSWPLVRYYVQLAITCRAVGAVGAIYVGYLFDRALGVDSSSGAGWWTWVIGGWAVGAVWAQHQVAPSPATPAVASLTPRNLADYLPAGLRWAPAAALGLVVWSTLVIRGVAVADEPTTHQLPSWWSLGGRLMVAALVAGAVALAEHRIVGRRQPVLGADLLAADDAIRTSAIHQVAGAGTAVICTLGLANIAMVTAIPLVDFPPALAFLPVPLFLLTVASWRYFAYRAWRVRRSDATGRATEPVPA